MNTPLLSSHITAPWNELPIEHDIHVEYILPDLEEDEIYEDWFTVQALCNEDDIRDKVFERLFEIHDTNTNIEITQLDIDQ